MSDLTLSNLSRRSLHVMIFIRRYFSAHGYPPSVQEICEHLKMQRHSVERHLALLDQERFMRWTPTKERGIHLID